MLIYIFILFWLFVLGGIDVNIKISLYEKRILFYSTILFFWILSFIRWKTGTDWDSYYECFASNNTLYDFLQRGFEPFYTYLNFYIKQNTSAYWVFLMVCGAIIYLLTSTTIFRYSPLPFVSLLVYLLIRRADIFFVRESIALAFCFYSIRFIEKRKFWGFIICILIGFEFHNSVIIFIPAYFIYNLKINIKKCLIALGILIIIMIATQGYITNSFGQIASILGDSFLDKTNRYIERGYDSGGASSVASAMIRGSVNRCILLLIFLYGLQHHHNDKKVSGLLNLYIVSIIIFVLFVPFSLTLNRLGNSYEMSSILLIGYTFDRMPSKNRFCYFILFYSYIALRFIMGTLYGVYSDEFLPYKTIFD